MKIDAIISEEVLPDQILVGVLIGREIHLKPNFVRIQHPIPITIDEDSASRGEVGADALDCHPFSSQIDVRSDGPGTIRRPEARVRVMEIGFQHGELGRLREIAVQRDGDSADDAHHRHDQDHFEL